MLQPVILVTLVGCALSAPQGCIEPCVLQTSRLPTYLDFSKPGNWTEHNEYDANGGTGKVHEEYGQVESGNARVRYFKKNYTSSSRGGSGQLGDFATYQLLHQSRGAFQTSDSLPKPVQDSIQQTLDRTRDQINQIRGQTQQTIDQSLQHAAFQSRDALQNSVQNSVQQTLDRTRDQINQIRGQTQQTIDHSLQQARDQLEQSRDILSRRGVIQSRGQSDNFGVRGLEESGSAHIQSGAGDFQSRDRTGGSLHSLRDGSQVREYEQHEERHHEESSSQKHSYMNKEVTSQQTVARIPHYHYRTENGQSQQIVARNTNVGDFNNQNSNQNFHQSFRQPSGQFGVGVIDLKDDMVECDLDHDTQQTVPMGQVRRMRRKAEVGVAEDDSQDDSGEDEKFQQQRQTFDQVNSFDQQPARGQYDRTIGSFDSGRNYDSTTRQPSHSRPNYQPNTATPNRANWFPRYHGTYNTHSEGDNIHVDENQDQEKVDEHGSTARPYRPIASTTMAEDDDMKEIMESLLIPDNYDSEEMRKAIGQIRKELNHTFYSQYGSGDQVELKNNSEKTPNQYEDQTQEPYSNLMKIAPNSGYRHPQGNIQLNQNSNFNAGRSSVTNENPKQKSQSNYDGQGVNLDQQENSPSSFDKHDEQQTVGQHNAERPSYVPERPQNSHNYHHNYFQNRYNDHPMAAGFHQIDVYQRPPRIYSPHEQPGIVYAPNPMLHPSVKVEQLIPVNKNWESYRMEAFNHYSDIHKEPPQHDPSYHQSTQNPLYDHRRGSGSFRPEYDGVQKPWSYNQRFEHAGSTDQRETQLGQGDTNYPDRPYAFGRPYPINQRPEEHQALCPVYPQVSIGIKSSRRPQMVPCNQLSSTVSPADHLNPVESSERSRPDSNFRPQYSRSGTIRSDDLERYRGDIPMVEPLGGSTRGPVTISTTANPVEDDTQQRQQGHDEDDYLQAPRQENQYPQSASNPRYDQERNQPQWPREIDSTTMRDNYHKLMSDLTNSEPYSSGTRRPSYPRADEQHSDHQFRDTEVQISTDLSLNNQRLSNHQNEGRQQEDHQISVRSDKLVQSSTGDQAMAENSWVANQRGEEVIPLQAQPSADLQAPVDLAFEATTPAGPGFWKKLGNKITNTYDKAKEKAKEVFG